MTLVSVTTPNNVPSGYLFVAQMRAGDNDNDPSGPSEYAVGTANDGQYYWGENNNQLDTGTTARPFKLALSGSDGTSSALSRQQVGTGTSDYRDFAQLPSESPYHTASSVAVQVYAAPPPVSSTDGYFIEIAITNVTVGTASETVTGALVQAATGILSNLLKTNVPSVMVITVNQPNADVILEGTIRLKSFIMSGDPAPRNALLGRMFVYGSLVQANTTIKSAAVRKPPFGKPPLRYKQAQKCKKPNSPPFDWDDGRAEQ